MYNLCRNKIQRFKKPFDERSYIHQGILAPALVKPPPSTFKQMEDTVHYTKILITVNTQEASRCAVCVIYLHICCCGSFLGGTIKQQSILSRNCLCWAEAVPPSSLLHRCCPWYDLQIIPKTWQWTGQYGWRGFGLHAGSHQSIMTVRFYFTVPSALQGREAETHFACSSVFCSSSSLMSQRGTQVWALCTMRKPSSFLHRSTSWKNPIMSALCCRIKKYVGLMLVSVQRPSNIQCSAAVFHNVFKYICFVRGKQAVKSRSVADISLCAYHFQQIA